MDKEFTIHISGTFTFTVRAPNADTAEALGKTQLEGTLGRLDNITSKLSLAVNKPQTFDPQI